MAAYPLRTICGRIDRSSAIVSLQERHQGELREFQRKLLGKQQKPKFSRELLNLRKIQEHLAKQKE